MNKEQLNYQHGWKKVESFRSRLTPSVLSSLGGQIIWIHSDSLCSRVEMDKCSIQKAIKSSGSPGTNREISQFADSIFSNECRYIKANKDEILALTSTPYGIYISIIASTQK
jgi:hypothetical protein